MSAFNVNLRQVLYILELFGTFTCTWPVEPNASNRKILSRNVQWAFAMFNVIFLMTSLAIALYHFRNDVTTLLKTACEMMSLLEVFLDLLFCKMKNAQLQVLIGKVKRFSEEASEQENKVVQGYIDRYKRFFSVTAMSYIVTATSFNFVPLFSEQELPADGLVPFSTKPLAVHCMVYASQVYCILLTALCIGVDFTIAVLFSFPAAKLDLLGMRLRQVNDCDMLVSCVKQHQRIIGFVKDTKAAVEALLFKTSATMGSAVICGAFPLIYSQSVAVMSQFLPLVVSGCAHLFVVSWPADDLKESSLRFAERISDVEWLGRPRKMADVVIIMIQGSRKALQITMGPLLPALTLEYFATFLTTVLSYFMTMRTTIEL